MGGDYAVGADRKNVRKFCKKNVENAGNAKMMQKLCGLFSRQKDFEKIRNGEEKKKTAASNWYQKREKKIHLLFI